MWYLFRKFCELTVSVKLNTNNVTNSKSAKLNSNELTFMEKLQNIIPTKYKAFTVLHCIYVVVKYFSLARVWFTMKHDKQIFSLLLCKQICHFEKYSSDHSVRNNISHSTVHTGNKTHIIFQFLASIFIYSSKCDARKNNISSNELFIRKVKNKM